MTSLIINQWKIRARFQNSYSERVAVSSQCLQSAEHLSVQSLKVMEAIICPDKTSVTLDFTAVESLDPSVFTTLTEVCETLRGRGQETSACLPDNVEILSAARRSSFTALFACTIQNSKPCHFDNNDKLIDAAVGMFNAFCKNN